MSHIAEKIAKLIAKANSTTHEEESTTFMAKVHQLLESHGLKLQDIGEMGEDKVEAQRGAATAPHRYAWMRSIAAALATFYGCELIYREKRVGKKKEWEFDLVGRESARLTAALMIPYIQRQVLDLANRAAREGIYSRRSQAAVRIGNSVTLRIWDMVSDNAAKEEEDRKIHGVNALVPVDVIQQVIEENYPRLSSGRARKLTTDTYSHTAAKAVEISRSTPKGNVKKIAG